MKRIDRGLRATCLRIAYDGDVSIRLRAWYPRFCMAGEGWEGKGKRERRGGLDDRVVIG